MERLIRGALIGWIALACPAAGRADSSQDLFKQGNTAYAAGQFSQAASFYESARSQGLDHWVLYYDLGNAYFKAGVTGKAAANYLRAFRLNPHSGDVIYNLNLVLTKAGDPLLPNESLAALFWRVFYILSLNTLAVLSSVLFIAVCIGGSLFFLGRWRSSAEVAFGALLVLVLLGTWFGLRIAINERQEAVVVNGTAEVRSAPNLGTPANFTVPEGRRVQILEDQEPVKDWIEIGVPQEGLKGWVPSSSIDPV
jgi:tetratricopeptide (TPR) repeat protein